MVSIWDIQNIPGLYDFYLPFLLVFAVSYGLLSNAKIFGDPSSNKVARVVNLILSMGMGLIIAPFSAPLVSYLIGLFGGGLVVIFTLILVLMIVGLSIGLTGEAETKKLFEKLPKAFLGFGAIVGILLFFTSGGLNLLGLGGVGGGIPSIDPSTIALLVMIGVTILVVVYLAGGQKQS